MSRVPLWKSDSRRPARRCGGVADGVRSTVALPLRADGVPVGVVVLVSRTPREPEPGARAPARVDRRPDHAVPAAPRGRGPRRRAGRGPQDAVAVAHELAGQTDLFAARNDALPRGARRRPAPPPWRCSSRPARTRWRSPPAIGAARPRHDVDARRALARRRGVPDRRAAVRRRRRRRRRAPSRCAGRGRRRAPRRGSRSCATAAASACSPSAGPTPRAALPERDEELLRLLAAEAAITIHRTDLLARLQSTARTDPLTGLPNRRVWDEDLERELAARAPPRRHPVPRDARPRPLQGLQRRARPPGRRRAARRGRRRPGARSCAPRTRSPATAARSSRCCCRTATRRARWPSSSACSPSCRSARRPRPASRCGTAARAARRCSRAPTPRSTRQARGPRPRATRRVARRASTSRGRRALHDVAVGPSASISSRASSVSCALSASTSRLRARRP